MFRWGIFVEVHMASPCGGKLSPQVTDEGQVTHKILFMGNARGPTGQSAKAYAFSCLSAQRCSQLPLL